MDAVDKIGVKVAKIKAAANGERYMGIPTVTMSRINELKEKARREGKTLADVYKEEEIAQQPAQVVGTVEEVKAAIAAKKIAEEAPPEVEPEEIKEEPEAELTEEEPVAEVPAEEVPEPQPPVEEPEKETEAPADEPAEEPEEEPEEPEEHPEVDAKLEFITEASQRTIKELRDFAREFEIPISSVRKDDIVAELADDIMKDNDDYSVFYEFFIAEDE